MEDAGLLLSVKLALVFLLDTNNISSPGKRVGRKREEQLLPLALPTALQPGRAGLCTGCGGSSSLPPSAWLESQTAPGRK